MRIDRLLVERGLVPSRNRAQELIEAGRVLVNVNGTRLTVVKPSENYDDQVDIEIVAVLGPEFVSRGGIKLQGALDKAGVDVRGMLVLDVGISTGGFTDCVLQAGAERVVGVDVGHGQLAAKLKNDPRVLLVEGVNARDLSQATLLQKTAGRLFDLAVVDVSFISLHLVLPGVTSFVGERGYLIALIKPQFEVGPEGVGKNGIVKNAALQEEARTKIIDLCVRLGLAVVHQFESPIAGSDGNREFFVVARKQSTETSSACT